MFVKRTQPWQVGYTDIELQVMIKVFVLMTKDEDSLTDDDDLTPYEEERAVKMLRTMETQYERLRIKTDSRDDRYDHRRDTRRDDRHDTRRDDRDAEPSREGPLVSYAHVHEQQRKEKYIVPPEATREPRKAGRRAVRTR